MSNLASGAQHSEQGRAGGRDRQTLRLCKTVLGKEHPLTLTNMGNLASVLSDQGKYEQTEEFVSTSTKAI